MQQNFARALPLLGAAAENYWKRFQRRHSDRFFDYVEENLPFRTLTGNHSDSSDDESSNTQTPSNALVPYRSDPVTKREINVPIKKTQVRDNMVYSSGTVFRRRQFRGGRRSSYKRRSGRGYKRYGRRPAGMSGRRIIKICDTVLKRRMEKKYHVGSSYVWNAASLIDPTTTIPYSLTNVTQGNTDTTRIGDKLHVSALILRFNMHLYPHNDASNGQTQAYFRIICFQWLENDAYNTPTVSKLLESTSLNAPWNHDQSSSFFILYDKVHPMNSTKPSGLLTVPIIPKFRRIDYNGGGTSGNKKIWLLIIGESKRRTYDGTTFATFSSPFEIDLNYKLTFYDS